MRQTERRYGPEQNREAAATREAISNDGNNKLIRTAAIGEASAVTATTHQSERGNEPAATKVI